MPKTPTAVEKLSFEEALRELDTVVRKLEASELSLDQAIALFERGQALAGHCAALLKAAELKVKQIAPNGDLADFDENE